jgi:hypothetical protein
MVQVELGGCKLVNSDNHISPAHRMPLYDDAGSGGAATTSPFQRVLRSRNSHGVAIVLVPCSSSSSSLPIPHKEIIPFLA